YIPHQRYCFVVVPRADGFLIREICHTAWVCQELKSLPIQRQSGGHGPDIVNVDHMLTVDRGRPWDTRGWLVLQRSGLLSGWLQVLQPRTDRPGFLNSPGS